MTEQTAGETELASGRPSATLGAMYYLFTAGLYEMWRRAAKVTVTNRKVTIGRGIVRRQTRTLPVPSIQDVSRTRIPGFGKVVISTAGGHDSVATTKWMSGRDARNVERAVISLIERRHSIQPDL